MSDRIAVMDAGRLAQAGPAADVFERPANRFVAAFLGAGNEILLHSRRFIVRPEKLSLRSAPAPDHGPCASLPAVIEQRIYQGINTVWTIRTDCGQRLTVCQQNAEPFDPAAVAVGDKRHVWWDRRHAVFTQDEKEADHA